MFDSFFSSEDYKYVFHRPMLEKEGSYITEKDGNIFILLNILGVDEKDLSVDVTPGGVSGNFLQVTGKTHDDLFNKDFDVQAKFLVRKEMDSLEWSVKNGFMTIKVTFKEPAKPSVKIVKK